MKHLLFLIGACLLISSCSTSKFDYQTAYKFSYRQYQQPQQQEPVVEQLLVSRKLHSEATPVKLPDQILIQPEVKNSTANLFETYQNASKEEKRAIRKLVKQDYKTLRKEYKKAKKDSPNKEIVFNSKMYIGLVIFAAGLLIAILASGSFGAVTMIVGIGLLAWGFIEQA